MKRRSSILLVAWTSTIALSLAPFAQAQTVLMGTTTKPTQDAMQKGGGLGGSSYVPANDTQPKVSAVQGIENNGKDASGKQGGGQQAAMITMAAMAALAASTCPNPSTQAICAASLMGAMAAGMTGSQMGSAKNKSVGQVTSVTPTSPTETPGASTPTIENSTEYQSAVKDLSKATKSIGATLGKGATSYTTADGKVISPSNSSSGSAAPLSSGEQKMLADTMKKIEKEIQDKVGKDGGVSVVEVNEGFGGGGARGRSSSNMLSDTPSGAGGGEVNLRQPASVAGDFKEFNGEKIGVAQDSMFEMMHRRYKMHGESDSFIKER